MITLNLKTKLTFLILCCRFSLTLSQETIVLNHCTNHIYTITPSGAKDTYSIKTSRMGKDQIRIKLKIVKNKEIITNYRKWNRPERIIALTQLKESETWKNIISQHLPDEQKEITAVLIDTIFTYNQLGTISSITILSQWETIESITYSGNSIQYHEKKINGITHKTTYFDQSYTAVKIDSTNQIIEHTNFYNGEFETFIPDPEHLYPLTPFKSLKTGLLYRKPKAIDEDEQLNVQVLGDHKFLVTTYQYNSEKLISYSQILTKKQAHKLAAKNKYITIETKRFDTNNRLLFRKYRNKKGKLTLFTEKDLQEIETTFTSYERSHYKLKIEVSETHLNYTCDIFSGNFKKIRNKWYGSDTFKINGNIFITKFQINDNYYQYTRYLNGKFLSEGEHQHVNFTINNLNEYENDLKKSNTILIHLDRTFHNENRLLHSLNRLGIGNDSFIVINESKELEKLIFQTPHSTETIIQQKPANKTKSFKDLSTNSIGIQTLEGQTLIPAKFDKINDVQIFGEFNLKYCHTKDFASILSNEGQNIIRQRKGLKKEVIYVSESFRKKHSMLLPVLFYSNDQEKDSFKLISLKDEVIMSGKGQLIFINSQTMALKRDARILLLNRDLQIINEECFRFKTISNNLFMLYLSNTIPKSDSLNHNGLINDSLSLTSKIKYQIADFNNGPHNGKVFDHLHDCPPNTIILNRKGESLICNRFGLKSDTMHIEGHTYIGMTGKTALYNYNKVGLQIELSNKFNTIPPIYDEIIHSGSLFARKGRAFDVYTLSGELMFSINTNVAIDTTVKGIRYNPDFSSINIRKNKSSYYILKFKNKEGLYDPNGETILKPEYDAIQIEKGVSPNHYLFFCELHGIKPNDILIKTIKNCEPKMFILNGPVIRSFEPKLMWSIQYPSRTILIHPNGKILPDKGQFVSSSDGFTYDIIDAETYLTLSQFDIYGDESLNTNIYKKTLTIDQTQYFQNENNKCGTLNCRNEIEIPAIYDSLCFTFDHQYLWYKWGYKKELWKLKFFSKNILASDSFDYPVNINKHSPIFMYSKNKKIGLMSKEGKVILNAEYDQFTELQTGYSGILSKNDQLYVWTKDMLEPEHFGFSNIYHYRVNDKELGYFAFKNHKMYLISKDFKLQDSSSDLFFGRTFHSNHYVDRKIKINDLIFEQMKTLKFIQSIQSNSDRLTWNRLYPLSYFPKTNQTEKTLHQDQFISKIETIEPVIFKDYKKLNWSHIWNNNLYSISNGSQTVSFGNEYKLVFLNVYIDSTLGFLHFDLNDLFKGSDTNSLSEAIYPKYLKLDVPESPRISQDKIFDHFKQKFTINGDQFVLYVSYNKFIKIPISELKPYMNEFWKKRF